MRGAWGGQAGETKGRERRHGRECTHTHARADLVMLLWRYLKARGGRGKERKRRKSDRRGERGRRWGKRGSGRAKGGRDEGGEKGGGCKKEGDGDPARRVFLEKCLRPTASRL